MKPEEEKQKIAKEILNGKVPVLLDVSYFKIVPVWKGQEA